MLSNKLKEHTKVNHQILEKKLVLQLKAITDITGYALLLQQSYSFFGGLEAVMDKASLFSFLPDYKFRRKSAALANDLNALKEHLPVIAEKIALPNIKNTWQAVGALYVIEGSVLGGTYIRDMIKKRLLLPGLQAFSFFEGYGERTELMWQTFRQAIDKLIITKQQEAMIIDTANDTFIKFGKWIDEFLIKRESI